MAINTGGSARLTDPLDKGYPLPRDASNRVNKDLLANQVYDVLFDLLVKNTLTPGTKLSVDGISKQLGVSRSPVASAFSSLEQDGFLVVLPQRGTFVRELDRNEMNAIYLARAALERVVVTFAIDAVDFVRLQHFRERFHVFHAMNSFVEADILGEFEADLELHSYFSDFLPEIIRRRYRNICNLTRRSRLLNLKNDLKSPNIAGRTNGSIGIHIRIIDAFFEKNHNLAAELLEYDVIAARDNILRLLF